MTDQVTETVTIPKADYESLIAAREDLEDIIAFDRAMNERGEGLPHEFMLRLLNGEPSLKVFREWRGLSQTALAKASGVNRVQIINIESDPNKTGSVKTLKKLADALDVPLDDLA